MKIYIYRKNLAKRLAYRLDHFLAHNSNPKLLMLSTGSSLAIINYLNLKNLGVNITVSVLDERFDKNPNVNNFCQLMETQFYRQALKQGVHFIETRVRQNERLTDLTRYFEKSLKSWKKNNPKGIIVITQGVGVDGHTVGIMPYPENLALFNSLFIKKDNWVLGYDATLKRNKYPLRITPTTFFLKNIVDHSFVFISGNEKKEVLHKLLFEKIKLNEMPAVIIRKMKKVYLFTDIEL